MGFRQLLADFQASLDGLTELSAIPGSPEMPLVVLVHGIGGCAHHWSNPLGISLEATWLFDTATAPLAVSARPDLLCSPPYKNGVVTDWCSALADAGISTVNFSQAQPCGSLSLATADLVSLLTNLESQVYSQAGDLPPYILLCHSRGGLVARQALKQLERGRVPNLGKVITLCTPHAGSYMPRLSQEYDQLLEGRLDFASLSAPHGPLSGFVTDFLESHIAALIGSVRQALLHAFGAAPEGEGFDELIPGSPALQQIADGETAIPGVAYHGFGGTFPGITSLYLTGAGRMLRLLTVSSAMLIEVFDRCVPELRMDFDGLAELDTGDSAVSIASSHWPEDFQATHQLFSINHMQALVDASLQKAVIDSIRS